MSKVKIFAGMLFTLPLLLAGTDVYLAGDSTMCDYGADRAPQTGWGTALKALVKPGIKVTNLATGGRSSRSFITEKRWDRIITEGKPGDFVIIQFGHNDAHAGAKNTYRRTSADETYKLYLKICIAEARANGLIPVLCTQTAICKFEADGAVREHGSAYIRACRDVARETGCDFVDLNLIAREKLSAMGPEAGRKLYMFLAPGEFPAYPQGRRDTCHLRDAGAAFYAREFADRAKAAKLRIAEVFR